MSLSKLIIAASLLTSPVALAKNASSAKPSTVAAPSGGYQGVGSNPTDNDDDKYDYGKGSIQKVEDSSDGYTGKGSNPTDAPTYYTPDNHYQDDMYYYGAGGYAPSTDSSGERIKRARGPAEVGLRYSMGQGLDVSPDLIGFGFYARSFGASQRYAIEASLDVLGSDPTGSANMRQGNLLASYVLFLNPDGKVKPYGSAGIGATWHGVSGSQNIFGALALGVGLDIALGKTISVNFDSRLIADSESDETTPSISAPSSISASDLNASQEFVISSAGLSFHF